MKKRRKKPRTLPPVKLNCNFCKENKEPNYKNYKELRRFMNERARILGAKRTGICSKHQRKIGVEIKRARHLSLLAYSP